MGTASAQNVAKIGSTEYETLAEAIAAVPTDGTATTIQMLADADLTAALTVANTQNITLDLNGKTVKNESSKSLTQLITVNGKLTIDDSSENGKIQNTASGKYVLSTGAADAELTLANGTVQSTTGTNSKSVYASKGTFVMTGGKILSTGYGVSATTVNISGGEISAYDMAVSAGGTISGGTLTSTTKYAVYTGTSSNKQMVVSGGTFNPAAEKAAVVIYCANAKVTGGTFNVSNAKVIDFSVNANTTGVILPGSLYAEDATDAEIYVNGELYGYYSIASTNKMTAPAAETTYKLTKHVNVNTTLSAKYISVPAKVVAINLNGKNITSTGTTALDITARTTAPVLPLTIEGEGTVSANNGGGCIAVSVNQGVNLTIKGGTYKVGGDDDNTTIYIIKAFEKYPSIVNIEGGNFYATTNGWALNIKDDVRDYAKFNVSGGTFHGFNPADNIAEGEHTNFVVEGYESVDNGDDSWTVMEYRTRVAAIGDVQYLSLADAVAAVPADGTATTITMIADETIPGNAGVTIPAGKNIVLDLNGKTVKNAVNENKASQVILNMGTLTIEDNSAEGTGLLTNAIEEGTAPGDWWSTPQYNYVSNVITNNGTLIVNSGKIMNTAHGNINYCVDNASNGNLYTPSTTINGGHLYNYYTNAIRQFCNSTTNDNIVNINGGLIEGVYADWIQLPGSDKTQSQMGTLNVSGGTLRSLSSSYPFALYVQTEGSKRDKVNVNITGGTWDGCVVFGGGSGKNANTEENISITDGQFGGSYIYSYVARQNNGFITGGIYNNGSAYYGQNYLKEGYMITGNTDPATKDTYPYIVVPIKVLLEVDNEVVVTTNPEATAEEQEAANAAVEELSNNVNVTADGATNVAEMDDVHTLVITIKSASVETEKVAEDVSATITQVTYDVQPYKNGNMVNETAQPITFRLPVPESFEDVVKVSHKHNGVIVTTSYEKIQDTGANKYVALSSDKFSEWILEYVDPNIELTVYLGNSVPNTMNIHQFVEAQDTHPNAMAVVASTHAAEVEGLTNVIVDYPVGHGGHYYECENFVLADRKDWYSPVDFTALSGSYSRDVTVGLTTICVPFSVAECTAFTKYIYHSSNEAGTTAYFNHIDNVDAGDAFLAQVSSNTTWICNFNNTRIYANTNVEGGALRGTYQKTTVSDCYKVNQEGTGLQYYSSESTYPFRAYFILTNENVFSGSQTRSLRIAFDELEEGTTGISGVGNDANNNVIYNAQGLRMNKIQNGLNIVNGKKILK